AHVDDPPDPRGLESRDELRLARLLVADRGEDHRLRSARSTVSIALRTRATAAAEFHSALPRRRPSSRPCRSIRMLVGSPRAPSFRVALPFGSRYTARVSRPFSAMKGSTTRAPPRSELSASTTKSRVPTVSWSLTRDGISFTHGRSE